MTGKKLASASLHVFCTREELAGWIDMLSRERSHGVIAFVRESQVGLPGTPETIRSPSLYRVFLYPVPAEVQSQLSMNDVRAREWGWVDVRPGREDRRGSERVLMLTSIEAEDYEKVPARPVKDVQWLKRKLKSELLTGVRGRNTITGGESVYRSIQYTPGAIEELSRGAKWVQDESRRTVFEPLKTK